MADKRIRIRLTKSVIGYDERQRKNIQSLGLGRMNSEVVHYDTPVIRGMVNKVRHLVEVQEVED